MLRRAMSTASGSEAMRPVCQALHSKLTEALQPLKLVIKVRPCRRVCL
jgi:hypothetical protein